MVGSAVASSPSVHYQAGHTWGRRVGTRDSLAVQEQLTHTCLVAKKLPLSCCGVLIRAVQARSRSLSPEDMTRGRRQLRPFGGTLACGAAR